MYISHVHRIMSAPPHLMTERLCLRRLGVEDAADMFDYCREPEVTRFLTWKPHKTLRYTTEYLKGIDTAYAEHRFFDWALTLRATGKMIGTCGYTSFDFDNNLCEIGYVINPRYEGYGLMTEAVNKVLDFAFCRLDAEKAICRFIIGNDKSLAVMKRCGMTLESVKEKSLCKDGVLLDVGICSVTKDEYLLFASQNE